MIKKILITNLFIFSFVSLFAQNKFLIEPYVQNVTNTSFSVLCETNNDANVIGYLAEAIPNTLAPSFAKKYESNLISQHHRVRFDNLNVGVEYLYKIACVFSSHDTIWGPTTPFRIPNYEEQPIVCTVIGDTQKNPVLWGHFAEMMLQDRPSFILHVGDMVGYGPTKEHWTDHFFYPAKDLFRYYPLYPVLGNHEMNHKNFYQLFDLPDKKWFYSLKRGNTLFVFVHTNRDVLPGSIQYKMLEETLANSNERWKVVLHHHPIYVSSGYYNPFVQPVITGDPEDIHLRKLYEDYGVDLVLNGHVHNYERTMPIYQDNIDKVKGVTYITTGGGGGSLDKTVLQRTWYMAETKSKHHYLKLKIWDDELKIEAIDSTGNIFDNWTKNKKSNELVPPLVQCSNPFFMNNTTIKIINRNSGTKLSWMLNGKKYLTDKQNVEIVIDDSAELETYVCDSKGSKSRMIYRKFEKLPLLKSLNKVGRSNPIKIEYFEKECTVLPDFTRMKPKNVFYSDTLSLDVIHPRKDDYWAARIKGSFKINHTDVYRFLIESFDGSKLFIDGKEIIDNDGMHYEILRENYLALEQGYHEFEIQYFDYQRRETLNLWLGPIFEELIGFNKYLK